MIRRLIKNHMPMLGQFGQVVQQRHNVAMPRGRGTKEVTEFHLNRKQAIYLTTQAGTPKARALTVLVVAGGFSPPWGKPQVDLTVRFSAEISERAYDLLPLANFPMTAPSVTGRET